MKVRRENRERRKEARTPARANESERNESSRIETERNDTTMYTASADEHRVNI